MKLTCKERRCVLPDAEEWDDPLWNFPVGFADVVYGEVDREVGKLSDLAAVFIWSEGSRNQSFLLKKNTTAQSYRLRSEKLFKSLVLLN